MKELGSVKMLLMVILAGAIGGCAMFNSGELHFSRSTTYGQELIDLKTAKDEGALTDEEYTQLKQKIINDEPFHEE
tara:strand:- start:923 stop:1150 length:228 start_codon:yes stop_codon:yes gene_type:complete